MIQTAAIFLGLTLTQSLNSPAPALSSPYCLNASPSQVVCVAEVSSDPEFIDYDVFVTNQYPDPTSTPIPTTIPVASGQIFSRFTDPDTTTELNPQVLFELINQYRQSQGLPPFEEETQVCQLVQSRAPELQAEIVGGGGMHAGFRARELPYRATENVIHIRSEAAALSWWLNSSIHKQSIESDNKYSCIACSGKNCAQIFTSYLPVSNKPKLDSNS